MARGIGNVFHNLDNTNTAILFKTLYFRCSKFNWIIEFIILFFLVGFFHNKLKNFLSQ